MAIVTIPSNDPVRPSFAFTLQETVSPPSFAYPSDLEVFGVVDSGNTLFLQATAKTAGQIFMGFVDTGGNGVNMLGLEIVFDNNGGLVTINPDGSVSSYDQTVSVEAGDVVSITVTKASGLARGIRLNLQGTDGCTFSVGSGTFQAQSPQVGLPDNSYGGDAYFKAFNNSPTGGGIAAINVAQVSGDSSQFELHETSESSAPQNFPGSFTNLTDSDSFFVNIILGGSFGYYSVNFNIDDIP